MRWRESVGVRWLEAGLPGATAAFSTRLGGVSESPFDSLNLGLGSGDERGALTENRARLADALRLDPGQIACAQQVHGARIAVHSSAQETTPYACPGARAPEADGHVICDPSLAAAVFVADCLPVAIVGPGGAAILHCGWRGFAAGIVAEGTEAIGATHAAVGPGIGGCCYEVGAEVLAAFSALGDGVADGRMLDLAKVARRLLIEAGVEAVEIAGLCTSCESSLFFSHRRDQGQTGRQAGVVWLDSAVS